MRYIIGLLGSRHIYTKGFKKTIYMQIIQIMHGIQMCPSSVKVSISFHLFCFIMHHYFDLVLM